MIALNIIPTVLTAGSIRLLDATPDYDASSPIGGGYGAPGEATRSQVSRYLITAAYGRLPDVNSENASFETGADQYSAVQTTGYLLSADMLGLSLPGAVSTTTVVGTFKSGPLAIRVDALSQQRVSRAPTNYTVYLPNALPAGANVWVYKEGVAVNVTLSGGPTQKADGTFNDNWQWQVLSVLDSYGEYKVQSASGATINAGNVLAEPLSSQPSSLLLQTVVGTFSTVLFLCANERTLLGNAYARLYNGADASYATTCSPVHKAGVYSMQNGNFNGLVNTSPFPSEAEYEGLLGMTNYELSMLEDSHRVGAYVVDIDYGMTLLKRIQRRLAQWN